jgi:LysR family glycine cleavage system transcriptional activator
MARLPPLNALRAFEAAGRHLNFRAAADEMGVTQGAVAQQVRLLEAQLALPLFDRLPKGLSFTTAGRGYHARVAAAFADLRTATDILRPEPGKVLVSVTPTFAAKWLIPNLPAFSAAFPEIDLRILATEKVSGFHGDGVDLAVRQARPPFGASLNATRLFRQNIVAVASPQLLQGRPPPVDATTLSRLPKLHDAHDLWPAFLRALKTEDRSGRGLRLSQTALAIDAAVSGQGVALVSRFLAARDLAAGTLVQITPEEYSGHQDFYLLSERHPRPDPATETVRQWLLSMAAPEG